MSSKYERELMKILSGEVETIEKLSKTTDDGVRDIYMRTVEKPFAVMRGAGSLGIDLMATRFDSTFFIEEKSGGGDEFYFSSRGREQLQNFMDIVVESGINLFYARRLKNVHGEKWRMYDIPEDLDETNRDGVKLSLDGGKWLSEWLENYYKLVESKEMI